MVQIWWCKLSNYFSPRFWCKLRVVLMTSPPQYLMPTLYCTGACMDIISIFSSPAAPENRFFSPAAPEKTFFGGWGRGKKLYYMFFACGARNRKQKHLFLKMSCSKKKCHVFLFLLFSAKHDYQPCNTFPSRVTDSPLLSE